MQPDRSPGIPLRALAVYEAAVGPLLLGALVAFGRWLDSLGLPWWLGLAGVVLAVGLALLAAGPLSVPAIHWLVRRWPALGRGRLLGEPRRS